MVWSLMMYGAALSVAIAVPILKPYVDKAEPKTPPSLKEVRGTPFIAASSTVLSIPFALQAT